MPKKTAQKTDELIESIRGMAAQRVPYKTIAATLGIGIGTVSKYATLAEVMEGESPVSTMVEEGDRGWYQGVTDHPIRSEDDAVKAFSIDLTVWRIRKMSCSAWTVGMKVKAGEKRPDRVIRTQQYRVKLDLERVLPKPLAMATDAIFERMKTYAPKYPKVAAAKAGKGPGCMAVFMLADVHFGKLCWAPETGESYDLKIAEAVYRNAVEDLLAESRHKRIDRILLPLGNDFLHIDNARNTTTAGTPQDVDGRYAKVVEVAEMSVIRAIESLMTVAPVGVTWVPGNHDMTTSYHAARTVQAWFRSTPRVTVDVGASPRKYVAWGTNLLGLTHGNEEKPESLPAIMATEKPNEWAASTCREWILGHMHRSRKWVTKPVDTHEGTTIRVMRSPASSDSWHHRRGYINPNGRAVEVYFYDRSKGYCGHAVAPARER